MNTASNHETDAIRSEINTTRQRMDDTMDALGDRLQPRHLLDEALGYLRGPGDDGESRLDRISDKFTRSCNTAFEAVTSSVKKNPVPALLIGAGVAWLIYENRRDKLAYRNRHYSNGRRGPEFDSAFGVSSPTANPWDAGAEMTEQEGSALSEMKGKIGDSASAVREKIGEAGERVGEMATKAKENTREAYNRVRERVVTTTESHPLEVGLVALAAGVIGGLAIPTPNAINRQLGPSIDQLRDRARQTGTEMINKGKRVAEVAMDAAKHEAEAQGLTVEAVRDKVAGGSEKTTPA